jgi:hypothetical protein
LGISWLAIYFGIVEEEVEDVETTQHIGIAIQLGLVVAELFEGFDTLVCLSA